MSLRLAPSFVGTWLLGVAACADSHVIWQDDNVPPSAAGTRAAGGEASGSAGSAASSGGGPQQKGGAGAGAGSSKPSPAGSATSGGTETGGASGASGAAEGDAGASAGAPEEAEACPPECCSLATLGAEQPSAESLLADSRQGFSSTQGRCGWSYGYLASGMEPFTLLAHFVESPAPVWRGSTSEPPWSAIYREKQHPNQVPLQWIVRRWTSHVRGSLTVKGHVAKADSGGDGVIAQVRAEGLTLWEQRVDDAAARDFELQVSAVVGTVIDLIVAPGGGDAHDTTEFTASISW